MSIHFLWVYAMIKEVGFDSFTANIFSIKSGFLCAILLSMTACASVNEKPETSIHLAKSETISNEHMGKCLLPGKLRKIGSNFTYLTPRRTVLTSAGTCRIRGGKLLS